MYINGDMDRAPLRMCLDQSYYLASGQAAAGTLLALQYRYASEKGQHVDVSLYDVMVRANYREPFRWEWEKAKTPRSGNFFARGSTAFRQLWPSKDGYVTWVIMMENPKPVRGWVEWMKEENQAGRWGDINWDEVANFLKWTPEDIEAIQQSIAAFMLTHTTKELEAGSSREVCFFHPLIRSMPWHRTNSLPRETSGRRSNIRNLATASLIRVLLISLRKAPTKSGSAHPL
jgi:crotonobetainyl-CoA:carnitine CoA-transferase CaiB-like acyl-CoA transferase